MNSLRRATPDSEAIASSEDERPWPTAKAFGSFPRKENSVPGLGGTIWTTQKRDSFKMEKAAQRNAAREARLAAPNGSRGGFRADATPSPAASDASGTIPFSIPMQPVAKVGRSMSHSHGQREVPQSGPEVLPLGLLAEEADTESESELLGGGLTHTTSHPPIGTLQRTSTFPSTYETYYQGLNGRDTLQPGGGPGGGDRGERSFETAFANLSLDHPPRRSQWHTKLGWDDVPNVNESRRHSLADIPTRRGSVAGAEAARPNFGAGSLWGNGSAYDWEPTTHVEEGRNYRDAQQLLDFGQVVPGASKLQDHATSRDYIGDMKYSDTDAFGRPFTIPQMYKVPYIKIEDNERPNQARSGQASSFPAANAATASWARPNRILYIVSFKCSRVDVFFLLTNTGLEIKEGDIVIVEADRGQDLGTVQHANVTEAEARIYKKKYNEEQYKWLMMFSKNNNQASVNPNAQLYGENQAGRGNLLANAPPTLQGAARENVTNIKPKAIKRLASAHEIRMLTEKEGNEAKAKRACQTKVLNLHLDMEILDAEWQWDFQKLIFYYYADHYINFKDLITELYRIYKTRIWLSAINPASFSQHALGQPPSGIGPGAVVAQNTGNGFSMMYGDPDPYGAVPPYRIGYETYTPNYPSIPGVPNSFPNGGAYGYLDTNPTPAVAPGITPTGTAADYNYYYDRTPEAPASNTFNPATNPFYVPSTNAPSSEFYGRLGSGMARAGLGRPSDPNFQTRWGAVPPQLPTQLPIGTRPESGANTGAIGTDDMMRREMMHAYLRGLPNMEDTRADEMSRER